MAFSIVLGNMVMILLYVVCGFLLIRSGKGHESHAKTLSAILLYICCCLLLSHAIPYLCVISVFTVCCE